MERRKPMKRTPMKRGRTPINPRSKKTSAKADARRVVVEIVLRRDRQCRGRGLTPVPCDVTPCDVHELKRGTAGRRECYLNPERCIALCRPCHTWVTEHPEAAHDVGLAKWSWEDWS